MIVQHDNLFQTILLNPVINGIADTLYIISGYATSAMAFHHMNLLSSEYNNDLQLNLIVGMVPRDGISFSNHYGFVQLANEYFAGSFNCSYLKNRPQVHSKLYIWCENEHPVLAYTGSANYTQTAMLSGTQCEVMSECDPETALAYYSNFESETIFCNHPDVENEVILVNDNYRRRVFSDTSDGQRIESAENFSYQSLPSVTVSLLGYDGLIQNRAGLNWGQRPGREPNQAYIQLSPNVYRSDFFPTRGIHFTVLTDDNRTLICTRAQKDEYGQAIETPHNNSLIGVYFRNRLGLADGAFVMTEDLHRYGRTDVTFYKIDEETYYMDFSV